MAVNKKRFILKIISTVLIISLLSSFVLSCSNKNENDSKTSSEETDTTALIEETDSIEGRKSVSDDLPEIKFDSTEFRTVVQESTTYDIWVEKETGDALNDEIYIRNRTIEERFDVVIIETNALNFSNIIPTVRNTVNAEDDVYDLVLGQMEDSGAAVTSGIFMNWYDIPNMNYSKPWYPKSIIENAATVNGKMYSMISDLCISYAQQTWALVYDKVVGANYNLPDIYSIVRDNKWTFDKLETFVKNVYNDLNGNGKNDTDDYYGMSIGLNGCMLLSMYYGFNQKLVTVDSDFEMIMDFNSEKSVTITEALYNFFYNTEGVWNSPDNSNDGINKKFINETALFCPMQVQYTYAKLRDYKNDYGILPFPKWDEEQAEYYSVCDAGCNILAVPITASNTEMIGIITEALSAYSWKTVLPVYYDIALDVKSTRDEESVEMLDIVLENRIIDFAYLYDGWKGWIFTLPEFVKSKAGFASTYAKFEKEKTTHYQKVLDFFLSEE